MGIKVLISGGSGNIGKHLASEMLKHGWEVSVLTRSFQPSDNLTGRSVEFIEYHKLDEIRKLELSSYTYIVNLAGASIAKKWTEPYKKEIIGSRIGMTSAITEAINSSATKPEAFFSASASGYYGDTGEMETDEMGPNGTGFLADVCRQWEESASAAGQSTRLILGRIGVVLDKNSGMLNKLLPQFKAFAGGTPGNGRQWLSWIHIGDLVKMIIWVLENDKISGPVNLCTPFPLRMHEFIATFARQLRRPAFFKAPAFALKLMLGESSEMVLSSQRLRPSIAMQYGFEYRYPELKPALESFFPEKER